jgi:hypothetical protein
MIKIYSASHPTDAHLLRGILESYGIRSIVRGEYLFNGRGELPVTPETAPSVWIYDDSEFDDAHAIALEYDRTKSTPVDDVNQWICDSCGEESGEPFTRCWNCGAPRPEIPGNHSSKP